MTEPREDWTYTFADAVTGEELATLPLTGVGYSRDLSGVGKLNAYLHLASEKVRALDPWAATTPRRTKVYAEYRRPDGQEVTAWGGMLIDRNRGSGSDGASLEAITFEGWLHRQLLLADLTMTGQPTGPILAALVERAQVLADIGLEVDLSGGTGALRSIAAKGGEIKPILELVELLGEVDELPLEFRVDCFRDPVTNLHRQVLRFGEPRIGRTFEDTRRTFSYPDGALTAWNLPEAGSGADNVMPMLGSGSGETQPFGILYDDEAGIDEIASGYPSWMRAFQASDEEDLDVIRSRAGSAMRAGIASQTGMFTGVQLRARDYLGTVDPGDDLALEVTAPSLREWPASVTTIARLLGESVTVGDAGNGDRVKVTIGGVPA